MEEVMELAEVEEEDLEAMVEVVVIVEVMVEVEAMVEAMAEVEAMVGVGLDRAADVGALEEEGAKVLLVEWVEWEGLEE